MFSTGRHRIPLLLATVFTSVAGAAPLSPTDFAADASLWKKSAATLAPELKAAGFVRVSEKNAALRAAHGGPVAGVPSGETLVNFDATGLPLEIRFSLYNRGDDGDMPDKEFDRTLDAIRAEITRLTGVKPVEIRRSRRSAVRADAALWTTPAAVRYLEWSKDRDTRRPEFIFLELHPPDAAKRLLRDAAESAATSAKGYVAAEHLETTPAGDRRIKDIPMVDQGAKGYCVVAATERVLRLYGLPFDEHELAQLADSSPTAGTDPAKLVAAFNRNASRLKVRADALVTWDKPWLESYAADYNVAARKAKLPPLPAPNRDWPAFVRAFPDTLASPARLAGRKTNTAAAKRFERRVVAAIEKGVPPLWGVTLGLVPETPALPQATGGHMRLIIGYNTRDRTILYSDSWGAGHECKVMPLDDAFAITDSLIVLIP